MNLNLLDLTTVLRSYGRGVILYAARWDRDAPLALSHLGDTEGDISFNANGATAGFTLPELTGPAMHEADYLGENPVIEFPIFLADPALMAVISPAGSGSAGTTRRRAVAEYTLAIFPEALFLVNDAQGVPQRKQLAFSAGNWTLDGQALTAEQLALLDVATWIWRGFFNRPPRRYLGGAGDAKKNIETVSFQGLHHPGMPEGSMLYSLGDPADSDIDLEGGS